MKQLNWLGEGHKMTKKLFVVEVMTEMVVVAEDAGEAEELAAEASYDLSRYDYGYHATEMTYLPGDWGPDSIPYGLKDDSDPDRTIEKWANLGAAPQYTAINTKLKK